MKRINLAIIVLMFLMGISSSAFSGTGVETGGKNSICVTCPDNDKTQCGLVVDVWVNDNAQFRKVYKNDTYCVTVKKDDVVHVFAAAGNGRNYRVGMDIQPGATVEVTGVLWGKVAPIKFNVK